MLFTVVCVFLSQKTKQNMASSYHGGRRGQGLTELRVTEVNILQVRACDALQLGAFVHISFSATKSFAMKCQNVLESTRFRHEHTTSETHEIFVFDKEVNAVYFYSSAEIMESVASSRGRFVYDKAG